LDHLDGDGGVAVYWRCSRATLLSSKPRRLATTAPRTLARRWFLISSDNCARGAANNLERERERWRDGGRRLDAVEMDARDRSAQRRPALWTHLTRMHY